MMEGYLLLKYKFPHVRWGTLYYKISWFFNPLIIILSIFIFFQLISLTF